MSWWKSSVIYQIYPRSFFDSNDDGVGDIQGVVEKISYLKELGVDVLWLSPIFPSPNHDFGYDISDYCSISKEFGTLDAFDALVHTAHQHNLKIILDGVFNHTSTEHPWFIEAKEGSKRDWYHFRERSNNWTSAFGGAAWSYLPDIKQYYIHTFLSTQADLNWSHPPVQDAILEVMKFWLERGVDGFRLDVFNCYHKNTEYQNNPFRWNLLSILAKAVYPYISYQHLHCRDQQEMYGTLSKMRKVCDRYDALLLGETLDEKFLYDNAAQYCGSSKLHLAFHFRLLHSRWKAYDFLLAIRSWLDSLPEEGWPTWVVSNHDFPRHATRWKGRTPNETNQKMKLIALLILTLQGTPCLYYGEEIGLQERKMKRSEIQDPVGKRYWPFMTGRDGARTPMQWETGGGFSTNKPWNPYGPTKTSVQDQRADPNSLWNTYRNLIHIRKKERTLQIGDMNSLDVLYHHVLIYERCMEGEVFS